MSEKYKYKTFAQQPVDKLVKEIARAPEKRLLNVKLQRRCSDHYILVEYIEESDEAESDEEYEVELIGKGE